MFTKQLLPAFSWMALIFAMCLVPGGSLPRVNWMSLFSIDKLVHVGMFVVLVVLLIVGFRKQLVYSGNNKIKKMKSLLSEINIWQQAQNQEKTRGARVIPAGYFLNWRSGIRKKIPIAVSTKRWQHIVDDAIKYKKVVHLWTHPHNFITGSEQFLLLENILKIIKKAQEQGQIEIMTQAEYCQSINT